MPDILHKKILYVGGFELPDKNAAAHRVLGNAKALREIGYEVVFLDVNRNINGECLSRPHDTEGFITYSQRHANSFAGLLKYCCNPLHVEEILQKHDNWHAIIAYNYPALALWKLKTICRKRGLKIYGDCTEWHNLVSLSPKFLFIQIDMFFRMRFVQKHLDGMIVISHYLENYYKKYTKTLVLPPLVDIQDPKWSRRNIKPHSGIQLVYFGSPGTHKDMLGEIISAVQQVSMDVRLQIVGLTKEQYLDTFPKDKNLVNEMTSNGQLHFCGRLSHKDTLEVVKNSDYSIFYRHRTRTNMAGFPTKFVESISCGVPVITTDTSDLLRYTKDGKNALILPIDSFHKELILLMESMQNRQVFPPIVEIDSFDYRRYNEFINQFIGN